MTTKNPIQMRILPLLVSLLLSAVLLAQAPQAFDFQGVARDASGSVMSSQGITLRISILVGSPGGDVAYQETHGVTTSPFGLFTIQVGNGTPTQSTFPSIGWGASSHFIQVELDASGGSDFHDMGTTQLLSVPYALHARATDCFTVSLLGDTLHQGNGCHVIIPGISVANGGCLDLDGDGYYDRPGCGPVDCDDNDPTVNPGVPDLCGDGIDNDCDGVIDNNPDVGQHLTWYRDADGDGFGDPDDVIIACEVQPGYVTQGGDCDDNDPSINPNAPELCDGIDNNCDGVVDEGFHFASDPDNCGACGEVCPPYFVCNNGVCEFIAGQSCDDGDPCTVNDMLELTPNGAVCMGTPVDCPSGEFCYLGGCISDEDTDGDGVADAIECPDPPSCPDTDGDGTPDYLDIDDDGDGIPTMHELGPDYFQGQNAQDTDGDGIPDYLDPDDDGDGVPTIMECPDWPSCPDTSGNGIPDYLDPGTSTCTDLDGDGFYAESGCGTPVDCNDGNPIINPGMFEICDGEDNNCDGEIDEGGVCDSCFDGIMNQTETDVDCGGSECSPCSEGQGCTVNSDCGPGLICENGTCVILCEDADGDGWTNCDGDCDDNNPNVYPGAPEICDGLDNNCDGLVDEGGVCGQCADGIQNGFETDVDCGGPQCPPCAEGQQCLDVNDCGPGFVCENGVCNIICQDADGDGWTNCDGDCDDNNPDVYPGAPEFCDGIDNNCDGQIDEGIDLASDPLNCGDCGIECPPDFTCENGTCVCPDNGTQCDDGDPCTIGVWVNCTCEVMLVECPPGETCIDGDCVLVCPSGQTNCGGSCVDLQTDVQHCGDCGVPCPPDFTCENGTCVCPSNGTQCDDGDPCTIGVWMNCACEIMLVDCPPGEFCFNGACISDTDSDGDGVPDAIECPDFPNCPDTDGDGTPDYLDIDDDGDGVWTTFELGPGYFQGQGAPDTDGDGIPDYLDPDDDGDGVPTAAELGGSYDPVFNFNAADTDADGAPDYLDNDDDGDGVLTAFELGPEYFQSQAPLDTDGDGTPDYLDFDDDGDGVHTKFELGGSYNPATHTGALNTDGDAIPNYLDTDDDGDGILTFWETGASYVSAVNTGARDTDGDTIPDYLDPDDDGDGIPTSAELGGSYNPANNTGALDTDFDGIPNFRDPDDDGDGVPTSVECPSFPGCPDSNGNGIPDYLDASWPD